jgi:hypothetical protein
MQLPDIPDDWEKYFDVLVFLLVYFGVSVADRIRRGGKKDDD